ncbi:unnamed protein product [Victoria cruziana]
MDDSVSVYKNQVATEAEEEEYQKNSIACSSSSSYKSAFSWSKTGLFESSVNEGPLEFAASTLEVASSTFSIESARISSSNWRRHEFRGVNSEGLVSSQKELSEEASRLIYINDPQQTNNLFQFAGNEIQTSKYSVLTFLPKNLFEQFHRAAYVYFLVLASLNQVPQLEVFAKEIAFLPLLFVLFVTAIKDAYEDFRRHRSDKIENNRMADVLVNGKFEMKRWKDIRVGEIIKVRANETLPCDMVLLSTSDATGVAYVQTTNLDGESNLKTRYAKQETLSMMPEKQGISGIIRCENPNRGIYGFQAYVEIDGKRSSLGPSNVALRGCELKNTAWAVGVAVYTGKETKAMLNSSGAPSKRSRLEAQMNREIVVLSFFLIALCTIITTMFGVWIVRHEDELNTAPFFRKQVFSKNDDNYKYHGKIREILFTFMMSVIMFQIMIPISLYISMEVVRLGQVYFMTWDSKLSDSASNSKFQCRALNINEDLGQIKYVFSDKTGTLTENKMEFRCASIRGADYNHNFVCREEDSHLVQAVNGKILKPKVKVKPNEDLLRLLSSGVATEERKHFEDFFLALAACNTIVPLTFETSDETIMLIDYQGESPDEQALVYAAAAHCYTLIERTSGHIVIDIHGKKQRFNILGLHEFDSDRKRMSVVVGCPDNTIKLFVKGADSSMFGVIDKSMDLDVVHETKKHLHSYSSLGLRTLVVAVRELSHSDFKKWQLEYEKASTALIGRPILLRSVAAKFETNLSLLGASAIEDKLQEGVPEAIESLRQAEIKVWVLTGDKQETAISIGYSCRLLTEEMVQIIINSDSKESCRKILQEAKPTTDGRLREGMKPTEESVGNRKQVALIIDGTSLVYILESELEDQKAGIVALVKNRTNDMTLSIGDGANDVSMLQVADVGVGISGQEGRQAVMASDFAIGQFRFLVPLLLVHGHWNYQRMGYMVLYNFYKSAVYVLLHFWYELYTAYTSTSTITGWSMVLYSMVYTTLPTVFIGVLHKDLSHETLLKFPQLYGAGQRSECYNAGLFWLLVLDTLWQSAVIFYVPYFTYRNSTIDVSRMGDLLILALVVLVSIHFAMDIMCWTWIIHAVLWGSVLATCICVIAIDSIRQLPGYWAIYHAVADPSFWLILILILVAAGSPHFVLKLIKQQFRPSDVQIAREIEKGLKPHHLPIASLESTVNCNSLSRSWSR